MLKGIDALVWEIVYKPIVDVVRPTLPRPVRKEIAPREILTATHAELMNSAEDEEALRRSLRDGIVQLLPDPTHEHALFTVAKADRLISDGLKGFGCRLNKMTDLWYCPPANVPVWVKIEAESYSVKTKAAHEMVSRLIDDLEGKVDDLVARASLAAPVEKSIDRVQRGGWKEGAKQLQASWNLGPVGQDALAKAFERSRGIDIKSPASKVSVVSALDESAKREVKVWCKEALARLRAEVALNAEQGFRSQGLAQRIRKEYGVSKTRSELIARQETSNFMAAYREARARDAGLKRYQWVCVRDSRTRKDHLALQGKLFYYSRPPITNQHTGARNNPGQDFRCRCVDKPVLE